MKIIFINGAPRSGKDTLADAIETNYYKIEENDIDGIAEQLSFKDPLIHSVTGLFGLYHNTWWDRYNTDDKDKPWDKLEGMSQREALIWMSETIAKNEFGKDFFGKAMVNTINNMDWVDLLIIPDSGFLEETKVVVEAFGKDNCIMINTFREGTDFDNDSRSLITGKDLDIEGIDFINDGSLDDIKVFSKELLDRIYN